MDNDTILKRNLLALSSKNTLLSVRAGTAAPSEKVRFIRAKTGDLVPVLKSGGTSQYIHSSIDPITEGLRFFNINKSGGYLVFIGFGAGYHIIPFLGHKDITQILIIDKDISLFRSVLGSVDLRDFILDPRVNFLIDALPDEITSYVLGNYFPAITGDLKTLALRSRWQNDAGYFESVIESLKNMVSALSDDYTVQAYFGKKWFKNTLVNLSSAEKATTVLSPVRKAMVTGAGPSLEEHIGLIKKEKKDSILIATDTSLPALLSFDILPDIVISIDCQHITYHHFLSGIPGHIPLVLDLASPPALTRITDNLVFFTSRHPFSKFVSSNWREFPVIDVTGGNVSHAAISLADALGAREILLFGMDFSYPEGKTYARGTYIYPYFSARTLLVNPLETEFFSFLLRNQNIVKEYEQDYIRYTTRPMISYRNRLEKAAAGFNGKLVAMTGKGVQLNLPSSGRAASERRPFLFAAGKSRESWKGFIRTYNEAIRKLPVPGDPVMEYLLNLSLKERDLWTTLLPSAAALKKDLDNNAAGGVEILKMVQDWTLRIIGEFLSK